MLRVEPVLVFRVASAPSAASVDGFGDPRAFIDVDEGDAPEFLSLELSVPFGVEFEDDPGVEPVAVTDAFASFRPVSKSTLPRPDFGHSYESLKSEKERERKKERVSE